MIKATIIKFSFSVIKIIMAKVRVIIIVIVIKFMVVGLNI